MYHNARQKQRMATGMLRRKPKMPITDSEGVLSALAQPSQAVRRTQMKNVATNPNIAMRAALRMEREILRISFTPQF
jgi:hypothetical protein